ncbi:hypothetical protein J132_08592, partial [Termitomyces sp. J132]
AVVHLSSLPSSHPLYTPICRAAKCYVAKHHSPLHHLFHITGVDPTKLKTIFPVQHCPSYLPSFTKHIAQSNDLALASAEDTLSNTKAVVYCDGSGYKNNIGVAAILYVNRKELKALKLYIGPKTQHIVYEAEIISILLGLHLFTDLAYRLPAKVILDSNSQATIKALFNQCPYPAHYLLD